MTGWYEKQLKKAKEPNVLENGNIEINVQDYVWLIALAERGLVAYKNDQSPAGYSLDEVMNDAAVIKVAVERITKGVQQILG